MDTASTEATDSEPGAASSFGAVLRGYRVAARLTQEMLAERAGLSVNGLRALEAGRRQAPHRDTVERLARGLGLAGEVRERLLLAAAPTPRQRAGATPGEAAQPRRQADYPGTLPVSLTPLIGREREVHDVQTLLRRDEVRLLTLSGPGGVGKTRLALAVADAVISEYHDGVWLVELASLADPALVVQAVVAVLGLREEPHRSLLTTLVDHLRELRLLLVLDNCEHLVAACAALVAALLRACPHLRLLATSRETLEAPGETAYRVPCLGVPDLAYLPAPMALTGFPAVALFLARAQERRPGFTLTAQNARAVAQICARLDGMPLALELAAVRVASLPVEAIAARLDDRFRLLTIGPRTAMPRQQTLRATLDWSYDLLSEGEERLLNRLSVFAGGCTLEAVETVCSGAGIVVWEVVDLLGSLVNKSLVVLEEGGDKAEQGRYQLLETVRQYGQQRLAATAEVAAVRDWHLAWCVALAEEAHPHLTAPGQGQWLDRLEREHDNLRAALGWSTREAGDAGLGLRLAGALWRFWYVRGYVSAGRGWLDAALARDDQRLPAARALALTGAGVLANIQGDHGRAESLHEEALALCRSLDGTAGIATSLNALGFLAIDQGQLKRAAPLLEEALALWRTQGDRPGVNGVLTNLGLLALAQGEYERASTLLEEALVGDRERGDTSGIALRLCLLGWVTYYQGEYGRAEALLDEAFALHRRLGEAWGTALSLSRLGFVAHVQGDYTHAAALFEESLALLRRVGEKYTRATSLDGLGRVAHAQGDYARATSLQLEALLLSHGIGAPGQVAIGLEELAWITTACGHYQRAALLGGAAEALREVVGMLLPGDQRAGHAKAVAAMRAALGEASFAAAWAEGRALPLDKAIALALEDTGAVLQGQ